MPEGRGMARWGWVVWFLLLVVSAYAMPFGFLGRLASPWASFFYWVCFALAAVISVMLMIRGWRD